MSASAQSGYRQSSVPESDQALLDHRLLRSVIRFALWKTSGVSSAEDLEQETCLKALQVIQRDDSPVRSPKAFLSKIVHDSLIDHWRRKRPLRSIEDLPERRLSYWPAIEHQIDERRHWNQIQAALPRLCPSRQTVIEMYYLREFSVREIADRLHASPSAVKMNLLRGRQELARMLGRARS